MLKNAKTLVYNQDYDQAVEVLEQLIEAHSSSVEGYNLLAYAYKMSKGNTSEAQ